jgi:hypothetical protein
MPNDSKHLLPMNSVLFNDDSQVSFRTPVLSRYHNPTLVNVREAADTSITALPAPPVAVTKQKQKKKPVSAWKKVLSKVKRAVGFEKKKKKTRLVIGEPTMFRHVKTGGIMGLMDTDGDWVDV